MISMIDVLKGDTMLGADWLDLAKFMPNMIILGKSMDIKKDIMRRVLHELIFVWNEDTNIVFKVTVLKEDTYDVCKLQIIGDSPTELETYSQKSIDEVIEIIKGGNKNE